MSENGRGPWMQTASGKQFFVLDPRPEDVTLWDVAHGLAQTARYAGHASEFLSVAQHSVMVSEHAEPRYAMAALFHDAGEFVVTDVPSPWKGLVYVERGGFLEAFEDIEVGVRRAVMTALGVDDPGPLGWVEIKREDVRAALTERRDLLAAPPAPWKLQGEPWAETVESWDWKSARARFLARYEHLQRVAAVPVELSAKGAE